MSKLTNDTPLRTKIVTQVFFFRENDVRYFLKVHTLTRSTALFQIVKYINAKMGTKTHFYSLNFIFFLFTVNAWIHVHPYDNKHDWNQTINHMSSSHSMFWIVIKPSPIFFRKFFHSFFPKNTLRRAFYRGTGEDWNIKNNNIMPDTSKIGVKFYLLIIPTDTRYMYDTDRN